MESQKDEINITEPDYKVLYYHLFNGITDLIEKMKELQQHVEEMFMNED